MSLREDIELYARLSGEDGSQETIATIGAYLRGYRQGKADAEPHWIPVTERLPEYGKAVLTVDNDGDYEINHIIDDEEGEFFYYGAVAWMPLPEPFKEVTT